MNLEPSTSSDLQTADVAIYARPCALTGIQVNPAAADATLIIYDNASAASGVVLAKVLVKASTSGTTVRLPEGGVAARNGLYADTTGAAAEFIVYYRTY